MDRLKEELLKKRQTLKQETGGKRVFKRAEIQKKELQKLREEEKLELEAKAKAKAERESFAASSAATSSTAATTSSSEPAKTSGSAPNSTTAGASSSKSLTDEHSIDNLVLPRPEVIRRLRFLKQPVTLFGEDDEARLERLKYVLKAGTFEVDDDITEGQTNDFLRDIVELRKRQKSGIVARKRKERDDGGAEDGEGGEGEGDMTANGGTGGADPDGERMRANFEELCDEDKILVFFKRLLNEWKQELDETPEAEKRTAKGKQMVAVFYQCARYLNPLFDFCRRKILPDDIRQALMVMVEYCKQRDYLAAMDHYIKLAIGNAPWPIGVTMVGIHERSAREKIYTKSVAHIMNDETTRKYLQSVKRLMTFCQRRYPTMPSRAVEFNSLANGSDLQSLLSEERVSNGNQSSESRLFLMPDSDSHSDSDKD
ncbi:hypothetical protein Tsubulata_019473 [Turnera subulata]|uniref:Pre-mRNA-splicing factor 18 n=1 Tax=Turnera subulata TaxID=218843 RepID=A0A9Q0JL23_9ROSI|nr:hypothetical protein Tsubulata_019473 [Turnera subulata]